MMTFPRKDTKMFNYSARTAFLICCVLSLFALSSSRSHGEEFHNALSLQGFTGLLNTPNASVTEEGKFYALFSNQKESKWRIRTREESYMFSVGFFSFAEIGGRLTEAPPNNDLSANIKIRVPFIPQGYYLPALAFGMQDIGRAGSRNAYFRTKYAVATEDLWRFRLSLGYGSGPDRMDGVFGGAEFKAFEWLYLLGENDTKDTNVGIRLVTPSIYGYPINLQVTAKTSLDYRPGNTEFGFGLQFPLGFERRNIKPLPQKAAEKEPVAEPGQLEGAAARDGGEETKGAEVAPAGAKTEGPVAASRSDATIDRLHAKLVDAGFQNVRVGTKGDALLVVEYENSRFNHNELDGLGVVAGTVIDTIPTGFETLRLVMKKKGIRVVQFTAPLKSYRDFLTDPETLGQFSTALQVSTDVREEEGTIFSDGYSHPSWLRSSLLVYPGLKTFVGNEVGAFNYLLSLRLDYFLDMWKGAVVNARADIPLSWSENLDDGKAFRESRQDPRLERLMLFQALKPAPTVMLNLGAGMYLHDIYGTVNEAMWTPGNGNHRFRLKQAYLDSRDETTPYQKSYVYLGSYRYHFNPLDVYLEGTGGQFQYKDKGFTVDLKRFFGDTSFTLFYKNVSTVTDGHVQAAGVSVAFPLTPRRDMKPYPVQVRGTSEWNYSQETMIATNGNDLYQPAGINPQGFFNLENTFYNRDRLSEEYVKGHLLRLRDAYLTYR